MTNEELLKSCEESKGHLIFTARMVEVEIPKGNIMEVKHRLEFNYVRTNLPLENVNSCIENFIAHAQGDFQNQVRELEKIRESILSEPVSEGEIVESEKSESVEGSGMERMERPWKPKKRRSV